MSRRRRSIRVRLTLTYSLLLVAVAATLVAGIYLFMRYAPNYELDGAKLVSPVVPVPEALTIRSANDFLTTLLIGSAAALLLIGSVAGVLGWVATGRMLRPLHDITAAARRAGSGKLDHRIALPGPDDELKELSDTFDAMLSRLELSVHTYRRFAANASHELRTPLATTQAMLDVAISEPGTLQEGTRSLVTKLREVNTRSIDTVDALLDLANAAEGPLYRDRVDLAALVNQALSMVAAEAADKGVRVDVSVGHCVLRVDRVLVRQLIVNLLQNAVRYNHDGGSVRVTAPVRGTVMTLRVVNTGPEVDADVLPLLAEPFYRVGGRSDGGSWRGRGLGLALASTIATVHGAELTLEANNGGGLTVGVRFDTNCG